jgi:hypothetical protein
MRTFSYRTRNKRPEGADLAARDPAKVTRLDLRCAVENLLGGAGVELRETEPPGCAIVW